MVYHVSSCIVRSAFAAPAGDRPRCPLNPPGNLQRHEAPPATSCAAFCSGRCAFHPDYAPLKPANITVYRLTAQVNLDKKTGWVVQTESFSRSLDRLKRRLSYGVDPSLKIL